MRYEYWCDCGNEDVVEAPIEKGPPRIHKCPNCGKKMYQGFGSTIYIPEHMRAGSDAISPTELGNKLNRSRPSGKRKIYY